MTTIHSRDPIVLLISIEKAEALTETATALRTFLKSKATVVETQTAVAATAVLEDSPHAVLVTDGATTKRKRGALKHQALAQKLVEYALGGGTVLLGSYISGSTRPTDLDRLIGDVWHMSWKFGDYQRCDSFLNTEVELAQDKRSRFVKDAKPILPRCINVKAVHLKVCLEKTSSIGLETYTANLKPVWLLAASEVGFWAGSGMSITTLMLSPSTLRFWA